MFGHGCPTLVIDPTVTDHLEVLCFVAALCVGVVERVQHAHTLNRPLLHTIDEDGLGEARRFQDGWRDVNHVMKLASDFCLGLDSPRPMHDRAVSRTSEVGCHLFCPLQWCIHRMRPAHRVVVERLSAAEIVEMGDQELWRLQVCETREANHLVECALERSFSRGAIVADDHVDQGVVQNLEIFQRVDQPPNLMIRVLQKPRIELHLSREYRS